ncbi:DUF5692 family protein [Paenibacillus sp. CF384]|uniref:DUF5692 family protein n=1 Tax=Paenibacillus sp. CF384 TaxID=1884382 RepID=UPI00089B2C97|nr:DUF5692 family protein [Paenibacillus sp. CF384]SDX38381.1 hypothetical protein SAMN05518855_101335 [Paenibacillus sp. CF384]
MSMKPAQLPQSILFEIILAVIIGGTVITAFSPLYGNGIINVVVPIVILLVLKADFFEKLKLSTLLIGRILVVVTFLGFFPDNWLVPTIVWLLRINILEATLTDYKNRSYYNVISGIALIASSFVLQGEWLGTYYVTTNEAMIYWAIAYTLWNWNFVIYNFKQQIGFYHIAVLIAPMLIVLGAWNPGLWLIMRANSLTVAGIFQISCKSYLEQNLRNDSLNAFITKVKRKPTQLIVMVVNVLLSALTLVMVWIG